MVDCQNERIFTETVRYVSVACLFFAAWRIWSCPCTKDNAAKPLLSCKDHDVQFALAANIGLILPLIDQIVKFNFYKEGKEYKCK